MFIMKISKRVSFLLFLLFVSIFLAACGLSPAQVDQVVSTVDSMAPSELAELSSTIEALPPEQVAAVATSAAAAGYATLSPANVDAAKSTVVAARATATAVGQSASSGERVNATQAPQAAPIIVYFFAQVPSESAIKGGVRYYLNWTTENANRVEIFGNVMDNPQQGSWPVYNESNNWTLWAANDQVWVEQSMVVQADQDAGGSLQNVSVGGTAINLTLRDPQFVDGDIINVDVNGVRVIGGYTTGGRHVTFPITLNSGSNTVAVNVQSEGVTPPMIAEVSISDVTSGSAIQLTRGLKKGETETFTITAP
jgi:outer membrane murein-binding lipoprotein Lpp